MKYETVLLFQSSQSNLIINEKVTLHQLTVRTTKKLGAPNLLFSNRKDDTTAETGR